MLFTAVKLFTDGLLLKDISDIKGGKVPKFLSGHTETNSFHNRTAVNFVLENVNRKQ
jgi:hypothetical protein